MENRKRVVEPEILVEQYRALLESGEVEALPLVISGNSMSPFLVHGRDTVYLSRLTRPVRRGDVLLYRRQSGDYILHRVYRVEAGNLTMVGDAQMVLEAGIKAEQVIAIMTGAIRKGKRQGPGCFWWEFFEKVWIRVLPARRVLRRTYTAVRNFLTRA